MICEVGHKIVKEAVMIKWMQKNKKWFFNGLGVFIISSFVYFLLPSNERGKVDIQGNSNVVTHGNVNNVVITNSERKRIAVVEVLDGMDVHLGDNVYPGRYGTSLNPLNMDIYRQGVKGIVYYDKQNNAFLSDVGRPTIVGQSLVEFMSQIVADIDFSCFSWVTAYEPDDPDYHSIRNKLEGTNSILMLGPTALVANKDGRGNFYERYAAVGIARSISLVSECLRRGINTKNTDILHVKCIINCYHGGIREGQSKNFYLQFNDYVTSIPYKTKDMRDLQEVAIDIPIDQVHFNKNNLIYVYVLPWVEDSPQLKTEQGVLRPAHFRDVGITHLEIQVIED